MYTRIQNIMCICTFVCCTALFAVDTQQLLSELEAERDKLDKSRFEELDTGRVSEAEIRQTKQKIAEIKIQLAEVTNELDNAVFYRNDVYLDLNIDLVDFYVYEYSSGYYQVHALIKNKKGKYLDWIKLRYNLYKNGSFVATDYSYIDYESYGYTGMSPYSVTFFEAYLEKVDFDSIGYEIDYAIEDGSGNILWDQILQLESVVLQPYGSSNKWQGVVRNDHNYTMKFAKIFACIYKNDRMIATDYTYLDVPDNTMPANTSAVFDSYINLPEDYDEIKYYLNYALYSLEGTGNLPPNRPIFTERSATGHSRIISQFVVFVIDPDNDSIDLFADYDNGAVSAWLKNYTSGYSADFDYAYPLSGIFKMRAKASDRNHETAWSDPLIVTINPSTSPKIANTEIGQADYKRSYQFQFQSNGGIEPLSWKINTGNIPKGLVLDNNSGLIYGTPAESGSFTFTILCQDAGQPPAADEAQFQFVVRNQKPVLSSSSRLNAFARETVIYSAAAEDPDGNSVSFSYLQLPYWLSASGHTLSGTAPNQVIEGTFYVIATDGDLADTLEVSFFVRTRPLSIMTTELPYGIYRCNYETLLAAEGGLIPYHWSIVEGSLPDGIVLDKTGVIIGQPINSGQFVFVVQVQDSDAPPQTDSLSFQLYINNSAPVINSPSSISIQKQQILTYNASATDADHNPLQFYFKNFPSWLVSHDNILSGLVPLSATDTSFVVIASDGDKKDSLQVTLTIETPELVIATQSLDKGLYLYEYEAQLSAQSGIAPYTWSMVGGQLPPGMSFYPSGILFGSPQESGNFDLHIQVKDSDIPPQFADINLILNITNTAPKITSTDTLTAFKLQQCTYIARVMDQDGHEITLSFSNLPSWLDVSGSTVSGLVPWPASDTSFNLLATDGDLSDSIKVKLFVRAVTNVESANLPAKFQLEQNYPNPFNARTTIKLDLPQYTTCELAVHDIHGKLVHKLYKGNLESGSHKFAWNASTASSGIYFIQFASPSFNQVLKCTLLK